MMNQIMANVQTLMPKVLDNTMPDISGPSIPMPKKWTAGTVKLN